MAFFPSVQQQGDHSLLRPGVLAVANFFMFNLVSHLVVKGMELGKALDLRWQLLE